MILRKIAVLLIIMLLSACTSVEKSNGGYSVIPAGTEITPIPSSGTQSSEESQNIEQAQVPEISVNRTVFFEQSTEIIEHLEVAVDGKKELTAFYPVDWAFEIINPGESFRIAVRYPGEEEILQLEEPQTPHVFWLKSEAIEAQLQIYLINNPETVVAKSEWIAIQNPANPTRVYEGDIKNDFAFRFVEPEVPLSVKTNLKTGKTYIPIPIEWMVSLEPGYYLRFVVAKETEFLAGAGSITPIEVFDNFLRIPADRGIIYVGWFEVINYHTQEVVVYTEPIWLPSEAGLR